MKTTTFIFILALVIITAFILIKLEAPTMDEYEWAEETRVIERGDTLWGLAETYCPDDVDKREWIEKVKSINGTTSSAIYYGDVITVLIPID